MVFIIPLLLVCFTYSDQFMRPVDALSHPFLLIILLLATSLTTLVKAQLENVVVQLKIIEMNIIGIAVCRSDISFFSSFCFPLYVILIMNIFVIIIIIIIVWYVD